MTQSCTLYISQHTFSATPTEIPTVRLKFIEFLLTLGLDDQEKESWKLVFTEAVNNAIEHGAQNNPSEQIVVRWWAQDNEVCLETQDTGPGPSPEKTTSPQLPEDPLSEGGRGLFIIHNFADHFRHWANEHGYIASISKSYLRLNSVMPQNREMEEILDELSDCYETLALFDHLARNLLQNNSVDSFIQSGFELFMESRSYDQIHFEARPPHSEIEYEWIAEHPFHQRFGKLSENHWQILESNESITWDSLQSPPPYPSSTYAIPVGALVPIYVNDSLAALIAVAYKDKLAEIRSNDIHNLRTLADIIGLSISKSIMEREQDEKSRLSLELNIATKLQHQLLPFNVPPPHLENYTVFLKSVSALEVAGDFAEIRIDQKNEAIGCVIDVMGKGVSAAILAGIFRSQFIAFSYKGGPLSTFLEQVNKAIEDQLGNVTMFITAFVFRLNLQTNEFTYSGAGHPPALLFKDNGQTEFLNSESPPLGLFPDTPYSQSTINLDLNDRIVVVTDGLYEWRINGEIFGWDTMVDWFAQHTNTPITDLWQILHPMMESARIASNTNQEDDETLLILQRNPTDILTSP